ncbi:DUF4371 domain-containing protein [Aphis craccivora]|uniref:DUF4371 domain-containing protein n=1 Tax=Aphis craccivora TaxID=307492 RepID=A0A6G0YN20_APHCR|nr:DUF4371 domain-containing protein [Aphis craccivora]
MTLERNCMNTIKPDFDINNISKMIEKHVYPNLFKSLQLSDLLKIVFFCEAHKKLVTNQPFHKFGSAEYRRNVVNSINNEDILES